MNEYDCMGDKMKNCFTAYLQKCIQWKRWHYLKEKARRNYMENTWEENMQMELVPSAEEMLQLHYKEELLLKECNKEYPGWNELSDQRLVTALLFLHEEERKIIYQHVFEERSFKEIGAFNGLGTERAKNIYYYAIRKICKWMGDYS